MSAQFLQLKYMQQIINIYEDDNLRKLHVVIINFMDLFEWDASLGNKLIEFPNEVLKEFQENIINIQDSIKHVIGCTKTKISVKISNLPVVDDNQINIFPRNMRMGCLIQLRGLVIKTYESKYLEFKRSFVCNKCNTIIAVEANYDKHYVIELPKKCVMSNCKSKLFLALDRYDTEHCKKYQEIKIQENGVTGNIPATLSVTLENDLVDSCKPGDITIIIGIVRRRWLNLQSGEEPRPSLVLQANHLQICNPDTTNYVDSHKDKHFQEFWLKHKNDPLKGRNQILKWIAPEINGMLSVKLGIALILAGGSKQVDHKHFNVRSESHILLMGDPGMGKSQLLQFASKILPHSVLTSGLGTTSAGLTVTAVKESGEWQLKAGALVMADNGLCCIDEINLMKECDRANLYEAMEQQTISVAKANIVCKLKTRCSIIAACNNSGHRSKHLHSPLLSRFDLVMPIRDTFDAKVDSQIADHVLNYENLPSKRKEAFQWSLDELKCYFQKIRSLSPIMTSEAADLLNKYYNMQRQKHEIYKNIGRLTVRTLESLIRLSQAHAKLLFKSEIDELDANAVINLMDACNI